MIQVSDVNKIKNTTTKKTNKSSSGGGFSSYLRDVMGTPSESIMPMGGVSVTDAIFAAQMIGDEEEKELRKKQLERGKTLLEKLEDIRRGLLSGYIAKDRLLEIVRFVKEKKFEAQDERLNEIIAEIELRVEVELAKLMK